MVRYIDDQSEGYAKLGANVVQGDLTNLSDLNNIISGCESIYFGMGVSPSYLEAALTTAAVAKYYGVRVFVNISQMTVSQMNIHETTDSIQQKHQWLVEQVLNWSDLPVVQLRSTVFLEHPFFSQFAADSILKSGTIRLPFGSGHTSPIAAFDVARVAAEILSSSEKHIGKIYELTGAKSENMNAIAIEYSRALNREIKYTDIPFEEWEQIDLKKQNLPPYLINHFTTMAKLHHENYYDRLTNDVEIVTGVKPMTVEDWVRKNSHLFQPQ